MKSYLRRAGIIVPFILLIYIITYMIVSWKPDKTAPNGFIAQEVVWNKLERIEQTLNKLGEYQFRCNRKTLQSYYNGF